MDRFNLDIDGLHKLKCRLCFKSFGTHESQIDISEWIEKKYFEVTQKMVATNSNFQQF